jgi:hypothetical protein
MNIGIKTTALLAAAGTLLLGGVGCGDESHF